MYFLDLVDYNSFDLLVLIKEKRRKRRASSADEGAVSEGEGSKQPRAKKKRTTEKGESADPYEFSSDEEAEPILRAAHSTQPDSSQRVTRSAPKPIDTNRLTHFKSALQQLFREERANSLPLHQITTYVNEKYSHQIFESEEIHAALERMTQDNQVMMADDIVFLI